MAIRVGGRGPGHLARVKGVPFRISINGVVYERVTDDATGQFVFDDATGQPVYAQVLA